MIWTMLFYFPPAILSRAGALKNTLKSWIKMGFGVPWRGRSLCERKRLRACAGVTKIRGLEGVQCSTHTAGSSFPSRKKKNYGRETTPFFLLQNLSVFVRQNKTPPPPIFLGPPSRVGYLLLLPNYLLVSLVEGTRSTRSPSRKTP
jgi:hypothetical protein